MDQVGQVENSHPQLHFHVKKKRGRPRKDPSLMLAQAGAAHAPPGFQLKKECLPQITDNGMVGQTVTGVVEATFDSGYLLTVRIGNSNTNLRGVVFKPGHYSPITAKTDVAPYLEMIRRNDTLFPAENQGFSFGQNLPIQPSVVLPSKHKLTSPITPAPPVEMRGTVVPVVLKPVNLSNGLSSCHQIPSDATRAPHMMASFNKNVLVSKPLGTFPLDRIIPACQKIIPTEPNSTCQVKGSKHTYNDSPNEGIGEVGLGEKSKTVKSSDMDTTGSSQSTATQVENGSEIWKFSPEDSGVDSKQGTANTNQPFLTKPLQPAFITQPLFNYGAGRMTELLKAVQEKIGDKPHQTAKNLTFTSQIEFLSPKTVEITGLKNDANSA